MDRDDDEDPSAGANTGLGGIKSVLAALLEAKPHADLATAKRGRQPRQAAAAGSAATVSSKQQPYTDEAVDALWRLLYQQAHGRQSAQDLQTYVFEDLKLARDAASLIDLRGIGLGLQLRWVLALNLLYGRATTEKTNFSVSCGIPRENHQLGSAPNEESRTGKWPFSTMAPSLRTPEALTKLCNSLNANLEASGSRREVGCTNSITPASFTAPMKGPQAVRRFIDFLRRGASPGYSDNSLLEPTRTRIDPSHLSDDAKAARSLLIDRLCAPHSGRPIQVAYMPDAHIGLSAVALDIFDEFENRLEDSRPVVLVPCSRNAPGHDFIGLDYLLHHLSAFFSSQPLNRAPSVLSSSKREELIEFIRQSLAITPCIVVFVGYEVTTGDYADIRRAIRDAPLLHLLGRLATPCVGSADHPIDIARFEQSQLVVLADGPIDSLQSVMRPPISLPRMLSPGDLVKEALTPTELTEFRREFSTVSFQPSETVVLGYLQMHQLARICETPRPTLKASTRYSALEVLPSLISMIRTHCSALDLLLLRFIAVIEVGVRYDTLLRCVQCWHKAVRNVDLPPDLMHLRPDAGAGLIQNLNLVSFLKKYQSIIAEGADEPQELAGPRAHPYEFPDALDGGSYLEAPSLQSVDLSTRPRSLVFRSTTLRLAVLRDLDAEQATWPALLMNEIVASESLRQQVLLLRHGDPAAHSQSRTYQRTLQALFHGFKSLPMGCDVPAHAGWPGMGKDSMLPADPFDRFRFLYATLFRGLLERSDDHRLSLEWAADAVKRDVLCMAHRAFGSSLPVERTFEHEPWWFSARNAQSNDLDNAIGEGASTLAVFARKHYTSAAVIASRLDDHALWSGISTSLEKTSIRISSVAFEPIDRAQFDLAVVQKGPYDEDLQRSFDGHFTEMGINSEAFEAGPWWRGGNDPFFMEVPSPTTYEEFVTTLFDRCMQSCGGNRHALALRLGRWAELRWLRNVAERSGAAFPYHMDAFATLTIASRIVELEVVEEPLIRRASLSPQALRVMARAGIEAMNALADRIKHDHRGMEAIWRADIGLLFRHLSQEVRKVLDTYALHFSHRAPDGVSMLILEARFTRTLGGILEADKFQRHRIALDFLMEAERRLSSFHSRHRLLLRLLLERSATLRGISYAHLEKFGKENVVGRRFLKLSQSDVVQAHNTFKAMYNASHSSTSNAMGSVWETPIRRQIKRTQKLASAYGETFADPALANWAT